MSDLSNDLGVTSPQPQSVGLAVPKGGHRWTSEEAAAISRKGVEARKARKSGKSGDGKRDSRWSRIARAVFWVASHHPDHPTSSALLQGLQALKREQPVSFMNLLTKYYPPKVEEKAVTTVEQERANRQDEGLAALLAEVIKECKDDAH